MPGARAVAFAWAVGLVLAAGAIGLPSPSQEPTAAELLVRVPERFADCTTFHAVGVEHEETLVDDAFDRRREHPFELWYARPDRLALTTRTRDGRTDGGGNMVVRDRRESQRWPARAATPTHWSDGHSALDDLPNGELLSRTIGWFLPAGDAERRDRGRILAATSAFPDRPPRRERIDGTECWRLSFDERDDGFDLWLAIADLTPVRMQWQGPSYGERREVRRVELEAAFDAPIPADAFTLTRPAGDWPMGLAGLFRIVFLTLVVLALALLSRHLLRRDRTAIARSFHPTPPGTVGGAALLGAALGSSSSLLSGRDSILLAITGWRAFELIELLFPAILLAILPFILRIVRSVASYGTERETVESGVSGVDPVEAQRQLEAVAAAQGLAPVRGAATLALAGVARPLQFVRGSAPVLRIRHPRDAVELLRPLLQEVARQMNTSGLVRAPPGNQRTALWLLGVAIVCGAFVIWLPS